MEGKRQLRLINRDGNQQGPAEMYEYMNMMML